MEWRARPPCGRFASAHSGKAHAMRMLQRRRRTTTRALLVPVLLLVAVAPAAAQELPDAVDDPVEAVQPLAPEPAPPRPAPRPMPEPRPAPAADPDVQVAVVAGVPDGTAATTPRAQPAVAGAAAAPREVSVPTGSLPFTGPPPGRIAFALLVGSLLVASGLVAIAYGRVADGAA